ncbi:MAG: cupin domain-containing protein [Cyanobacteriota bacterium]
MLAPGESTPLYENKVPRLGINFQVSKFSFEHLQVMDARLVTIAPGAANEKHRHAHESIFLVLQGEGVLHSNGEEIALAPGDLAYVPRWAVHQTHNSSNELPLRMVAITDFGLTSALLGNYDARTRLKAAGPQAFS